MHAEDAFLQTVCAEPGDDAPRLIYADWLEEQGDLRGEFLRIDTTLNRLPQTDARRTALQARALELQRAISPAWLAAVDRGPIANCGYRRVAHYRCPKNWESLDPTDEGLVRFCGACRRDVYYCTTVEEARDRAGRNECVFVASHPGQEQGDLQLPDSVIVGRSLPLRLIRPPSEATAPQMERMDQLQARVGQRVRVAIGTFRGMEGRVQRVRWKGRRITVQLKVLGRKSLDFHPEDLEWE